MPLNRRKFFAAVTGLAVMSKLAPHVSIAVPVTFKITPEPPSPFAVRDAILPDLVKALEQNSQSMREYWKALVKLQVEKARIPPETLEALRKRANG